MDIRFHGHLPLARLPRPQPQSPTDTLAAEGNRLVHVSNVLESVGIPTAQTISSYKIVTPNAYTDCHNSYKAHTPISNDES